MSNFSAAWTSKKRHLSNTKRRKVVVEHEPFVCLIDQSVNSLDILGSSERHCGEALCFAASEECRSMCARKKAYLDGDGSDFVKIPSINSLLTFDN